MTFQEPPGLDPRGDAIFLDFDGTLVEIAPTPDAVEIPQGMADLLNRLHDASEGALALVSGRAIADLAGFLPGYRGPIIGSHGAEARGLPTLAAADGAAQDLAPLHARFADFAAPRGLLAEPKPHGAAIHFRGNPEAEDEARAFVEEVLADWPDLKIQPAKMAFELKPKSASKDIALRRIADEPPFAGRRPVYAGDDATDEPAIGWAQQAGGLGVKIGDGASQARHRLAGPAEVLVWLRAADM
ncbi:trehalose-phosphatase [Frigidibacter oleivorans]|uniref:trehalose-phosphatase n=1 Tax=Frigidibacter oleivorans TaxID=2487129 RepID=UPI0013DF8E9F|nr:trehalose-phosphatase [Frigidibacter oleivorans]